MAIFHTQRSYVTPNCVEPLFYYFFVQKVCFGIFSQYKRDLTQLPSCAKPFYLVSNSFETFNETFTSVKCINILTHKTSEDTLSQDCLCISTARSVFLMCYYYVLHQTVALQSDQRFIPFSYYMYMVTAHLTALMLYRRTGVIGLPMKTVIFICFLIIVIIV